MPAGLPCQRTNFLLAMPMHSADSLSHALLHLPKAELHLHLEGCLTPSFLVELARKHGEHLDLAQAEDRFRTSTFPAFLELFKWATSYLRDPDDYAQLAGLVIRGLASENCRYAEITLSVGIMLLRKQDVDANFAAILGAVNRATTRQPVRVQWIFDAVRQFGLGKAMDVARLAVQMKSAGVVAFGMGGDEESLPTADFRKVYDYVASEGLHRVMHAGEMGGPESVRDAIEILGAERIGHGITSVRDENLMDLLIARQIPLEICPQSNLRTGALAKLLGVQQAHIEDHPLREFLVRTVPVTLSTDDPAMFHTSLQQTYAMAVQKIGLSVPQIIHVAEAGFRHSFLPEEEKRPMISHFRGEATRLGLL